METYTSKTGAPTPGNGRASDVGTEASFTSWSFKELLSELGDQARRLVRAEVDLARAELREEANKVKASAGLLVGGGVAMLLGGIAFVFFAIIALTYLMPLWLSSLIVTVLLLGIGAAVAAAGLKRLKQVQPPNRTIQTLKEDSQWASRTVQSMKSQMQGHA